SSLRHLPPGSPVLELAHGPGHLQASLMARSVRAYGIDLSPQMGELARERLLGQGFPARLALAKAQTLPFPAGTFAAVISTFPTEFIADPATLSEVRRVLRPGAPLIVVPTAAFTSGGAGKAALGWAYRATGQHDAAQSQRCRIAEVFEPHGFTVEVFDEPCPRSLALVVVARKSP
ncbi:MAG: class I SAM-dependent methyltransferase, partial [Anaerolineae bacterium]|nr:class I SAM-dependent methyltransferase [Anaerolineae bacterium]